MAVAIVVAVLIAVAVAEPVFEEQRQSGIRIEITDPV